MSIARLTLVSVLLAACGGDQAVEGPDAAAATDGGNGIDAATSVDASGTPTPVEALRASYEAAFCAQALSCGLMNNDDTCRKLIHGLFAGFETVVAAVGHGSVAYDPVGAAACFDSIAHKSCNPGAQDNRVDAQACDDFIAGTIVEGGPCFDDVECASHTCRQTDPACSLACCPGSCVASPPPLAPIGASCASVGCAPDAYCDSSRVCRALLSAGAPCASHPQCGFGLMCMGAPKTCVTPPTAGQACLADQCGTTGLACDPSSNRCAPYLLDGATCDPANNLCAGYLLCDSTSRTCKTGAALGQPCSASVRCAPGGFCKGPAGTSVCTAPQPNGETCTTGRQCASATCIGGTCAAFPACY